MLGGPPSLSLDRRGDCSWLHHLQDRRRDSIVDPQDAEGDAAGLAIVEPSAAATIARDIMLGSRVANRQLASTAPAPEQPGQQAVAMLGGAVMSARWEIVADHPADRLRALPIHVPLMGPWAQGQPLFARLTPAAGASRRAVVMDR